MNRRLTTWTAALALAVAGVASAQEQATVLKRDGSRVSGRFEAWNRNTNTLYLRLSLADQRVIPVGESAVLEVAAILIIGAESQSPQANIQDANDALWWTIVTMATVGYGDKYPVTLSGRVIARKSHRRQERSRRVDWRAFRKTCAPDPGWSAPAYGATRLATGGALRVQRHIWHQVLQESLRRGHCLSCAYVDTPPTRAGLCQYLAV